jgi:hypothetical protein
MAFFRLGGVGRPKEEILIYGWILFEFTDKSTARMSTEKWNTIPGPLVKFNV